MGVLFTTNLLTSMRMRTDQQRTQEQVLELLPMISEINAVSEELNKYRSFELVLMSGGFQEDKDKAPK